MTAKTWSARLLAGAAVLGLCTVAALAWAMPADASCFETARVSAHPFIGVVVEVDSTGRVATVRTDDGRTVTVRGTEASELNALTSVDRTYLAGARYEFHPINDADPYQDNACTATRLLFVGSVPPAELDERGAEPALLPIGAGAIAVGGLVLWLMRRRRPQA